MIINVIGDYINKIINKFLDDDDDYYYYYYYYYFVFKS